MIGLILITILIINITRSDLNFDLRNPVEYKQFNNIFVENLSIVDIMMFNVKDEIIKMLDDYELV